MGHHGNLFRRHTFESHVELSWKALLLTGIDRAYRELQQRPSESRRRIGLDARGANLFRHNSLPRSLIPKLSYLRASDTQFSNLDFIQ